MFGSLAKVIAGMNFEKENNNLASVIKRTISFAEKVEKKASISLKKKILGNSRSQQQMVDLLARYRRSLKEKYSEDSKENISHSNINISSEKSLGSPKKSPREKIDILQQELKEAKILQMQQENKIMNIQFNLSMRKNEIQRLLTEVERSTFSILSLLSSICLINLITHPSENASLKPKLRNHALDFLIRVCQVI